MSFSNRETPPGAPVVRNTATVTVCVHMQMCMKQRTRETALFNIRNNTASELHVQVKIIQGIVGKQDTDTE